VGQAPRGAGPCRSVAREHRAALYLMATGERAGAWAVLMKDVVEKLTNDDIVAISAYIASLEP
jgi:cytochrome c553